MKALGFIEVSGVVAAVDALDIMCKSSNVEFVTWERKLGGRMVTVVITGSVSDVAEAIECAKRALELKGNFYQSANCICLSSLMLGDVEESKRYYKIAVHNGGDPNTLKAEMKKIAEGAQIYKNEDLFWDL